MINISFKFKMSKTIPKIKLPILYKKIAQNKNFVKLTKALY